MVISRGRINSIYSLLYHSSLVGMITGTRSRMVDKAAREQKRELVSKIRNVKPRVYQLSNSIRIGSVFRMWKQAFSVATVNYRGYDGAQENDMRMMSSSRVNS